MYRPGMVTLDTYLDKLVVLEGKLQLIQNSRTQTSTTNNNNRFPGMSDCSQIALLLAGKPIQL